METSWYYVENGQDRKGPVPESELKRLLAGGQLPATTLVWSDGMAQWTPAKDVAALRPDTPAVPPPIAERNWYYSADGQERKGPLPESALKRMLTAGEIAPSTLVWSEGLATWAPAASTAAFQSGGQIAATPATPQPLVAGPFFSRTHNRDLMAAARASLQNRWGISVAAGLIYFGISMVLQLLAYIPFIGCLASIGAILIEGALLLGWAMFFLALARNKNPEIGLVFGGFNNFGTALGAYMLILIFTLLWTLLFIIPGIIASYRYAMTFFLLADQPTWGPLDAIRRSKEMMRGNKWKLFCLTWRFFWWALLCILTCFIGFIWLIPYMQVSLAKFYDDLKPAA